MSAAILEAIGMPDKEEQLQRLAALLLTVPRWGANYTEAIDAAKWLIGEAERVGWRLRIDEPKQ